MSEVTSQVATDVNNRVSKLESSKRILITNINGLLGYNLFEHMRNDYQLIKNAESGQQPHRFLGTLNTNPASGIVNPSPSDAIKILDSGNKPNTFVKQVKNADYVVLDISQFNCDLDEAALVLKTLKEAQEKE